MTKVNYDPYWDGKTGGGVRCSSTGTDANKYHDPSTQVFEKNGQRSVASLLPAGRFGLRGVVIPRATTFGGSRGFDPHKPRLVNIDPDIKGQACVVDLSQISKEKMEEAFTDAANNPLTQGDIRLLAAQTFHNLAVGYEPVGMAPSRGQRLDERRHPLNGLGYVTPRASLGGGQVQEETQDEVSEVEAPPTMLSPSVTPKGPVEVSKKVMQKYKKSESIVEPLVERVEQPIQVQPQSSVFPPLVKVTFEVEGWGRFEANYHQVIKNDCLLVLVYDKRFIGGNPYFPPQTDKVLGVKLATKDTIYFVHSFNNRFEHNNFEYCLLVIDQEHTSE